jgi:hypothetical protein
MVTSFRLAPMSPVILILTLVLLLLPIPFFVAAFTHHRLFVLPALVLLFIDARTYLWFRPTVFIVGPTDIEVIWPLCRRRIRRDTSRASAASTARPSAAKPAAPCAWAPAASGAASAGCGPPPRSHPHVRLPHRQLHLDRPRS